MWSSLVDMSKDDCRKALRTLELETYGSMVDVLRAQGHFSSEKKKLLSDIAAALSIPLERHKAEIRRAVNDDTLNSIAEVLVGPNTATEWAIEGRRHIPLLPRPTQQTILTALADESADYVSTDHDNYLPISEAGQRGAEVPVSVEPASPEPSKTQVRAASPSGVIVLPSGAAIQMKREPEEEEVERKKRKAPLCEVGSQIVSPSSSPPAKVLGQVQQIPMTSRTMPFPPGSTPLKIALPTGARTPTSSVQPFTSTPKQVIIVSSSGSPNTPSILQKTLSVPMKTTTVKPTVMYTATPSSNAGDSFKPRPKPLTTTQVAKPRPNAIVMSQKTPLKTAITPAKHAMPVHAKIVVQQKPVARAVQKPQHVVVQQKGVKQAVVTNVQVKGSQGFSNLPVQLRTGGKPTMQLKQDAGGQMKMLSISGGTKILPKPSQPVYVVTASTTPLTMVTRTVPASCSPRVMTVTTGSQPMKWSQSALSGKSLQTVHVMTQSRRHDSVVLLQKSSTGKGVVTHTTKESPANKAPTKPIQKPVTTISSPGFASSIQQLPQTTAGANVFLVDLSNQEKVANNAVLADILQASGILSEGDSKTVTIDVDPSSEETEEIDGKEDKEEAVKDDSAPVTSLSIEEAVEMLNRSDTPETRALLSQAGIQISDEIADSEEEEQVLDTSPSTEQVIVNKKEETPAVKNDSIVGVSVQTSNSAPEIVVSKELSTPLTDVSSSISSSVHSISSRPRSLDIFTKALASANINLDSFMEEEDDASAEEKDEGEGKPSGAKDESADSSADPLDLQLAALTGELGH